MARGGINLVLVRKAREALLARGQNPSIDAVRIELGNTGSKTTIQRYLKELGSHDPRPVTEPARLSDELSHLVAKLLERLMEEGNEALIQERAAFAQERAMLEQGAATLTTQLAASQQEVARLQAALQAQVEELKTTQSSLQSEITRNARISQSCSDLEVRVREKDEQIRSLEDKHQHARDALEHYRSAAKEQRDQELRRHEAQLQQLQQEQTLLQQTLMVKQDEITRLIRDNERLLGEHRQQTREAALQREAAERLRGDVGLANAATARAEGAKGLLQEQLEMLDAQVADLRAAHAAGQAREATLLAQLQALQTAPTETTR